ncbi:exopolysaccharide biosynthesis polyprenyl glycosylphosphotransferase [Nocardioides sp.]|uniref:exopolysaccharide biosynthesis polyprenyl glycosylphosphotransferase n=1 Tax=Nocardioides sp. TaxID=35761 RepID=UPI002ED0FF46
MQETARPHRVQRRWRTLGIVELGVVAVTVVAGALLLSAPVALWPVLLLGAGVPVVRSFVTGSRPGTSPAAIVRFGWLPVLASVIALRAVGAPSSYVDQTLVVQLAAILAAAGAAALVGRRRMVQRVVAVGDVADLTSAARRFATSPTAALVGGVAVTGEWPGDATPEAFPPVTDLGRAAWLAREVEATHVVIHPGPGLGVDEIRRLTWELQDQPVTVAVAHQLPHVAAHRLGVETLDQQPLLTVARPRPSRIVHHAKALLDRTAAAAILLVLVPLLVGLAALIRLDSPGKALFTQERVGRNGKLFQIYKFRTMVADAEDLKPTLENSEGNGLLFKQRNDPRVTRVGRVLRRTSLDEIPQLINVLRGEMSLVGPRPALPEEVEQYSWLELRRLAVMPGITGAWQVGGRSELSREAAMELDVSYTDNWSLRSDIAILGRTIPAVLKGRGAM